MFLGRNVTIRAVREETAIASISLGACPFSTRLVVRSVNEMTVFGDSHYTTVVSGISETLFKGKLDDVLGTVLIIRTIFRECRGITSSIQAGRPRMIMSLSERSGMHKTGIQTSPFVLYSISFLTIHSIVDQATTLGNS
jgi:hypothetical protein